MPCVGYLVAEIRNTIESVITLLGKTVDPSKYTVIDRGLPHTPKSLELGTMGVYTFLYDDKFLKIGKAGPSSNARLLSQHYNPGSAMSTLAASILTDDGMASLSITEANFGNRIKQNCRRIDIILDADLGVFTLELVEEILHYKYEPKYECFKSQR